ncbi:MAG: symmetrical bis(5'-nucleosyl)-tetraphosphatase [Magnetococcales bacterium]|nr:symmetrical bis(5'-nucleosyl)-tetraphosphatase [Magnetococcales bacterium]
MAVYAVGDVHGCLRELEALLAVMEFDAGRDTLWLVGDLINRGPDPLGVVRLVRELDSRAVVTLGNHEIRAIVSLCGQVSPQFQKFATPLLVDSPDAPELLEWLCSRPLLHHDPRLGATLVHAGICPTWSLAEARRRAKALSELLADPARRLELLRRNRSDFLPASDGPELDPWQKSWRDLAIFTRLRRCTRDGACLWTRPPEAGKEDPFAAPVADSPFQPWYEIRDWQPGELMVYGHWATAGVKVRPHSIGLDSGCVYGGVLTGVRLDDPARPLFQVPGSRHARPGRGSGKE